MSWRFLKVKKNQKFGDLKVIDYCDRPGWVQCICWCGQLRGAHQDKLLKDEVWACTGCMARVKMERVATK
jgi:hypothetical protein